MRHILLAAPLVTFAVACGRAEAAPDPTEQERPVTVHHVTSAPLAPEIRATGMVAGKEEIPLAFKVGGQVAGVAVDEGQQVRAGQLLAELAPTEIAAATTKALEARAKAARDLARARTLHADSIATQSQLDDATTAFDVAEQDVRAAEFNRALARIVAPATGVILQRMAEPGSIVNPGTPILVLRTERRGLVLRAGLADRDAMRVRVGSRARVEFDALDTPLSGRVTQVAAAATPGSGTFEVEVTLPPTRHPLASGLIGRVIISTASRGEYPMLPLEAVVEATGDSAVIFTLPPGATTVARRTVRLAQVLDDRAAVAAGLVAGERVVTRGAAWLDHGQRVRVTGGDQ